jgi:hypothetical protein
MVGLLGVVGSISVRRTDSPGVAACQRGLKSALAMRRPNIALDLAPRGRVYRMAREQRRPPDWPGRQRSGASRKALRLYEAAGILPAHRSGLPRLR